MWSLFFIGCSSLHYDLKFQYKLPSVSRILTVHSAPTPSAVHSHEGHVVCDHQPMEKMVAAIILKPHVISARNKFLDCFLPPEIYTSQEIKITEKLQKPKPKQNRKLSQRECVCLCITCLCVFINSHHQFSIPSRNGPYICLWS